MEGRKPVPQAQSSVTKAKPRRSENDGWTKVIHKKAKKKLKVRIRPEVIVI